MIYLFKAYCREAEVGGVQTTGKTTMASEMQDEQRELIHAAEAMSKAHMDSYDDPSHDW